MPQPAPFHYTISCADAYLEDVLSMLNHPHRQEVSYSTFSRVCSGLRQWAESHGHDRTRPLSHAAGVSFYRSTYLGSPCYYLVTSEELIHIWTPQETT